ncbi:MAG: hypothetical protein AB1540_15250 [Bdellovibrionota bacterium]
MKKSIVVASIFASLFSVSAFADTTFSASGGVNSYSSDASTSSSAILGAGGGSTVGNAFNLTAKAGLRSEAAPLVGKGVFQSGVEAGVLSYNGRMMPVGQVNLFITPSGNGIALNPHVGWAGGRGGVAAGLDMLMPAGSGEVRVGITKLQHKIGGGDSLFQVGFVQSIR